MNRVMADLSRQLQFHIETSRVAEGGGRDGELVQVSLQLYYRMKEYICIYIMSVYMSVYMSVCMSVCLCTQISREIPHVQR